MEVKRVPLSSQGQAIDPSGQAGPQEKNLAEKQKKKKKNAPETESKSSTDNKIVPEADWGQADLSKQPVDSETVVDLLRHAHEPVGKKPAYIKKPATAPAVPSKLNQKY